MKIPKKLPQFKERSGIIAVLGGVGGAIYLAKNGVVEKISEVEEPAPQYGDNEGFFVRSGKGSVYGRGSVLEDTKNEMEKRFAKKAALEIDVVFSKNKDGEIYLLADKRVLSDVPKSLKSSTKKHLTLTEPGNYTKTGILKILEKLQKSMKKA